MKISEVTIKNFRALRDVTIPLQPFSILIGENDVGKTSVLSALSRFYDGKKLSSPDDWYNRDTHEPITVSVTYTDLPKNDDVQKIAVDGKMTVVKQFAFDASAPKPQALVNGEEKPVAKSIVDAWLMPHNYVFVPVHRSIGEQFSMTKTAVLGKLLRNKMQIALGQSAAAKHVQNVVSVLRESVLEYQERMETCMKEQVHNDEISLEFGDLDIDPIAGIKFKPMISEKSAPKILIENRGAGTQNNLIIALFRVVAQEDAAQNIIFAFEEPENSLHPGAQRQLFTAIQAIADKTQTLVTTHSPVFIDRGSYENNIWLSRHPETRATQARAFDKKKLNTVRDDLGIMASDALLKGGGNCVVLVEGDTEEEAFPTFMKMMGLSTLSLGVSIIKMGGSDEDDFRRAIQLMEAFDIPCVAVLDGDDKGRSTVAALQRRRDVPNLKGAFSLDAGKMIEDYYPPEIIIDVINERLNPSAKVPSGEIGDGDTGRKRKEALERIREDYLLGGKTFPKKMIGMHGTIKMQELGMPVPDTLKDIFNFVKAVATGKK